MSIKKHIPNFLTCCNLFSGCVGVVFSFQGNLEYATYLIWLAMIFDFLDGFVARLLKVHSEIGKQLDSLADMVTFGFLPSVMIYQILKPMAATEWMPYVGFLIAVFSALRLAKFNIDDRQQSTFIGLPTPANALFISSIYFIIQEFETLNNAIIIVCTTVLFSLLLVSPLELFSLKFKNFGFKGNEIRVLFLVISLLLIVFLKLLALPAIIVLYLFLSLLTKILKPKAT